MCVYVCVCVYSIFIIHLFKWKWLFEIGLGKNNFKFHKLFFIRQVFFLIIFLIKICLANSPSKVEYKGVFSNLCLLWKKKLKNYNTIVISRFLISFFFLIDLHPIYLQFVLNLIQF